MVTVWPLSNVNHSAMKHMIAMDMEMDMDLCLRKGKRFCLSMYFSRKAASLELKPVCISMIHVLPSAREHITAITTEIIMDLWL